MLDAAGVCPTLTAILNAYSIYCCLIAICEWMDDLETISRYGRGARQMLITLVASSAVLTSAGGWCQSPGLHHRGGPSSRWLLPLFRSLWLEIGCSGYYHYGAPQRLSLVGNAIYTLFGSLPIFFIYSSSPLI